MARKKPTPTFSVRFVNRELTPEKIPLRAVTDALAAVQDLASGRDPLESSKVPTEMSINLIDVKHGSAIYSCTSHAPIEAMANLIRAGKLLSANGQADNNSLVPLLKPVERLSEVARTVGSPLEVISSDRDQPPLLIVEESAYERISKKVLLRGDATVIGKVERAGGAVEMRCGLRVPGRRHMLYCGVKTKEVVQRLGQHLYEQIAAVGTAVWIHHTWYIYAFEISDFSQPKIGNVRESIDRLRNAGLKGWDDVEDPEAFIRDLRS